MKKSFFSAKSLAALAMLSAISIVAGKYLAISAGEFMRFSLENLPILFAGIAFGPVAGALVGIVADLTGCLLVGYTINPVLTVGAALIGICSGALWRLFKSLPLSVRATLSVGVAHLIGSVIVKSAGLAWFYTLPFGVTLMWRLLNYVIVGAAEGVIIYALMKSRAVLAAVSSIKDGGV